MVDMEEKTTHIYLTTADITSKTSTAQVYIMYRYSIYSSRMWYDIEHNVSVSNVEMYLDFVFAKKLHSRSLRITAKIWDLFVRKVTQIYWDDTNYTVIDISRGSYFDHG